MGGGGGGAGVGVAAGGIASVPWAVSFCAGAEVAVTTIVRPSLPNVAMTGTVDVTVTTAFPLLSRYVADGITLLPNVNVGDAGPTSGSRENVILKAPGSFAIAGFTG